MRTQSTQKYITLVTIFLVVVSVLIVVWLSFFKTAGKDVNISVSDGDGTRTIAQDLKNHQVIFSPMMFSLYVYQRHLLLQSGDYKITSSMTVPQIAQMMNEGKVQAYKVTIPEGYRLSQIDALLTKRRVIKVGELIKVASTDEGYLFPDTYKFPLDITAQEIRDMMVENFAKKTADLKPTKDQIILASIVEREAFFDADRAKIAGVYQSRLDIKMKLQSDPTVQYAKGSWAAITVSDYQNAKSAYNTYLNDGLPPGPICNPGLKSILAAMNPVKDGSLYFLADSKTPAKFFKTLQERDAVLHK